MDVYKHILSFYRYILSIYFSTIKKLNFVAKNRQYEKSIKSSLWGHKLLKVALLHLNAGLVFDNNFPQTVLNLFHLRKLI